MKWRIKHNVLQLGAPKHSTYLRLDAVIFWCEYTVSISLIIILKIMEFKANDLRNKLGYPHQNIVCANVIESIEDFKSETATFIGGDISLKYKFSIKKFNEYLKIWKYEAVKDLYKNVYIFRPL